MLADVLTKPVTEEKMNKARQPLYTSTRPIPWVMRWTREAWPDIRTVSSLSYVVHTALCALQPFSAFKRPSSSRILKVLNCAQVCSSDLKAPILCSNVVYLLLEYYPYPILSWNIITHQCYPRKYFARRWTFITRIIQIIEILWECLFTHGIWTFRIYFHIICPYIITIRILFHRYSHDISVWKFTVLSLEYPYPIVSEEIWSPSPKSC